MKCKHLLTLGMMAMAVSCFSDVPVYGQTAASKKITFESIQETWRQRQKKFASAKFTLTIDRKESLLRALATKPPEYVEALQNPTVAAKLRSQYHDIHWEAQISIRGDRIAYHERPLTAEGKPQFSSFVKHYASDGVVSAFLDEQGDVVANLNGQILKGPRCPTEELMDLLPVTWEFGNRNYVMPIQKPVRVTEASAATVVDSHACVLLEIPDGDSGRAFKTYCLDPDAEYSILKFALLGDGKVLSQIDSHYERTKEGCWIPTTWTAKAFSGNRSPDIVVRVVATHYEINPTFPEGEFQIAFPPGTVVDDARRNDAFLVKADGSKRMITGNEVFATYEEIVKTETGKAVTQLKRATRRGSFPEHFWRLFWLVASVSLLIVFCGIFYVRQRRKRYQS
jgi:hypothetical protein